MPTSLSAENDPPEFHRIVKNTLERGYITDEECQLLRNIKAIKELSPKWQMAYYHYYLGKVFLFHCFDRVMAMYHMGQVVRYAPNFKKAWVFYLMSMTCPLILIKWFYKK